MDRATVHKADATAPTSVPTPRPADLAVVGSTGVLHDATSQINLLREALQTEKRRLGFFLGAGCPLGVYDEAGEESACLIPDVAGLTKKVEEGLERESGLKDCWSKLCKDCTGGVVGAPTVEHILTQLRTILALKGNPHFGDMSSEELKYLESRICELIASEVDKQLPNYPNAYRRFAAWIGRLSRVHAVEVFTPNYDLLMEQALESERVPFFDGFVGAREPFFDLSAMEQDAIPSRWVRLWKLHGAINWVKRTDDSVFRCYPVKADQQLLIYPSHLKYDQSRRMPYLAMLDRLRSFFREPDSMLIICGYSFADQHLNEVLIDGLRGNHSAHCFALMFPKLEDCTVAVSHAAKNPNLTLLATDGAVIGARQGSYRPAEGTGQPQGRIPGTGQPIESPAAEKTIGGSCRLGNFHHLGLLLEAQSCVKDS